jgi:hypothetical protein
MEQTIGFFFYFVFKQHELSSKFILLFEQQKRQGNVDTIDFERENIFVCCPSPSIAFPFLSWK